MSTTEKMHKSARRRAREFIVQGLYDWQLTGESAAFIEQSLRENDQFPRAEERLLLAGLRGVIAERTALDSAIAPHLSREVEGVNPVEQAVLWLAAWEILYTPETPLRVIINEAIEVTKTFGGPDGHRFVNGVLDQLAAVARPEERGAR